jgi:hypothetical protein
MTVHIGSKIYTEYKKYTYASWTMPVLAENGTVGSSSYAARASSKYSVHDPWKAFNGTNIDEEDCWEAATRNTSQWLEFYSPDTLELNTIKFTNRRQQYVTVFNPILVTGSIDGGNYFEIGRITPPSATQDAQYTLTVSSPKNKHCKYIRFQTTSDGTLLGDGSARPNFGRIEFTGKKVTGTTNGSASDYDYTVFHDGKIEDIYFGKTKIGKIYKGSTLVYASTVPDTDFLKQPDFAKAVQFNQGQSYQADVDCWLCIGSNRTGGNDPYLEICPDSSFGSNTVRVFMMTQRAGISFPCGGTMIPLKKGWWYRSINLVTVLLKIPCVATGGGVPYKHRNGLVKMPNYTTGVSVAQNTVMQAATDIWLYSRGSTRKIEVGKTSSAFTTIAEGVHSATEEPSTLVFIEKGLYYRTTGTDNRFFKCLE